jgi:hypothetical protein
VGGGAPRAGWGRCCSMEVDAGGNGVDERAEGVVTGESELPDAEKMMEAGWQELAALVRQLAARRVAHSDGTGYAVAVGTG